MNTLKNFDKETAEGILKYAGLISQKGWVCNTLGNVAVRVKESDYPDGVIYTKRKGVSLSEMTLEDVAVTDIAGELLHGINAPSVGHQLNREVFKYRKDINAVIHLHINEVVAYFSLEGNAEMKYISDDTALVLGKHVYVCERNINVEKDASTIKDFIKDTNCFVMPNHGVTALGRNLSEAFHRMSSFAAELQRVIAATTLSKATGQKIHWVDETEIKSMHEWGEDTIYGKS
jgi:L-fuculose-phosphate aldolase